MIKHWPTCTLLGIIFTIVETTTIFASNPFCDLQIFGDFFVTETALKEIHRTYGHINPLAHTGALLKSCKKNIVNFEGVATISSTPLESKEYLLKMPPYVSAILNAGNITLLTLANNHSMDYGLQGLKDTLFSAHVHGLFTIGAHDNPNHVLVPLRISLGEATQTVCLGAFSSTFPKSFWADEYRGGTAYASPINIRKTFSQCPSNDYKIAIFHWGEERSSEPHELQRSLAELSIDLGVDLVLGHHPHVIQPISIYRGKPIFYSLGNFVFASRPIKSITEGLAVRLQFIPGKQTPNFILVPLNVHNDSVHFNPRSYRRDEFLEAYKQLNHLLSKIPQSYSDKLLSFHEEWGWVYDFKDF